MVWLADAVRVSCAGGFGAAVWPTGAVWVFGAAGFGAAGFGAAGVAAETEVVVRGVGLLGVTFSGSAGWRVCSSK
jgi:hypothetical protein